MLTKTAKYVILKGMERGRICVLSKKERAIQALQYMPGLCCPLCGQKLVMKEDQNGLACANHHTFDISRKGYVNLAGVGQKNLYSQELFEARGRIFKGGFYEDVAKAILSQLNQLPGDAPLNVLDAGCGEGYYLAYLMGHAARPIWGAGIDLSREAIQAATNHLAQAVWAVADLRALPFEKSNFHAVLDIMTPANYEAFFRVLKPAGKLYKVYPGQLYLREIREAMGRPLYEEGQVADYLETRALVEKRLNIQRVHKVSAKEYRDFVFMTPLTEGLSLEEKEALAKAPRDTITIDLHLAVCSPKQG